MPRFTCLAASLLAVALGGCAAPRDAAAPSPPAASSVHVDSEYGFRIAVPAGVTPRRDFGGGYLAGQDWKAYAEPGSQGVPRLAMALPGSNRITAAELRIGVSDAAAEVRRCTTPPRGMESGVRRARINGIDFTQFRAQDAAMSHYMVVDAYRTVHAGRCYAVDLMVYGVNPQVYSPPAAEPFPRDEALRRLRAWLDGFAFLP